MASKTKKETYEDKIRGYLTNNSAYPLPGNLAYNPYNNRLIRKLDALAQNELNAEERIVVELERRRSKEEEEAFTTRLLEIFKPTP